MTLRAFPKPAEIEGIITISPAKRAHKRNELFHKQRGKCAECGRKMSLEHDRMDSCTLDHIEPQPMGHAKNDADRNLRAVCWTCNAKKGSRRGVVTNEGK